MENNFSRRQFIGIGAAAAATAGLIVNCNSTPKRKLDLPPLLETAPDGPVLKAGLIGCGGRGSGAAIQFLSAGPNLELVALGDVFSDRIQRFRQRLKKEKNVEVANDKCFIGFDAFKKVIDSGVDVVLLATPPHFRPEHFAAAIEAKKHVFMEKPVAVDPVGVRSVMSTAKRADNLGLNVVTGTQRRHQHCYIETLKQVANGAIGEIVSANCYWNQNQLWFREWKKDRSDMENMIRDWVNWTWLSGDHIVEQHIHNIDVINWFTGKYPTKAVGFGARQRRRTGDQYDMFSVDFVYDDHKHTHSMCRQINGCATNVSEWIVGTKGMSNCRDRIFDLSGKVIWKYKYPLNEEGKEKEKISPYYQEHIDFVTCIRQGIHVNEAERTASSNLIAIMGRESAYTGKEVSWDDLMASDLRLGPKTYEMGRVDLKAIIPVPGTVDR